MAQIGSGRGIRNPRWLAIGLYLILLALLSFGFARLVIKDFSQPLMGAGDTNYWEYTGYYVSQNFHLWPLPHLDLINDQAFYPYGVNGVFQPWSFERDFFYASLRSIGGIGPWVQLYYLLSVILTALGSCLLLVQDYGLLRAGGISLILPLFNFYALFKYPVHTSYAVIHWTVLNFIADFLLVKRVVLRQPISLRFLLLRFLLIILALGQELGYVAGFALTSFTISGLYLLGLVVYRWWRETVGWACLIRQLRQYQREWSGNWGVCLALLGVSLLLAWLYVPLVVQISSAAKQFDFSLFRYANHGWETDVLRLFIPYFPKLNPVELPMLDRLFQDSPEGYGAGSPGWFLLTLGLLALWQSRKNLAIFVPLLTIWLLCLAYDPSDFPTLRLFPWFAFNRIAGRCTIVYPVILCLFALHLQVGGWPRRWRRLGWGALILLGCLELGTTYSLQYRLYQPPQLDPGLLSYMRYVRAQPGEAVLDWPFCVTGGNGLGAIQGLCPYYAKTDTLFSYQRFHEKKVVGQYYGRLHPSQFEPFMRAGWQRMFSPNRPEAAVAEAEIECFQAKEWQFFTDFFTLNDFAGINLYTDILPPTCVKQFHQRLGDPAVKTVLPGVGSVEFIPKPTALRNKLDRAAGQALSLHVPPVGSLDFRQADLLQVEFPQTMQIECLEPLEQDLTGNRWRWGVGPETQIYFRLDQAQPLWLDFAFQVPQNDQGVWIAANGTPIHKMMPLKKGSQVQNRVPFAGVQGVNTLMIHYRRWNRQGGKFRTADRRKIAVAFQKLAISR